MKIKYKAIMRSTNIEPPVLMENIVTELDRSGYNVTSKTQNSIEFKYNIWGLGSRNDVFRRLDGGIFNIHKESKNLALYFYLSPAFEITATCVAVLFGVTQDYHALFFIIFIAVMFSVRLISVKIAATRIMEEVLRCKTSSDT